MGLNWIDVKPLSFNTLLLLEQVQLSWMPGWVQEAPLGLALRANPAVAWFMQHKCPEIADWVQEVLAGTEATKLVDLTAVRAAEEAVMQQINDWLVYVVDPARYDAQPFLGWDPQELLSLTNFKNKSIIDVGSGTGRLAFLVAPLATTVYAVEPIGNLRATIREKTIQRGINNIYTMDGLITRLPFPNDFIDVTMVSHVFGADPQAELAEMLRVTRPGGMVIMVPGTAMHEEENHIFLIDQGFNWSVFMQPVDGPKRKYWREKY